MISRGRLGFSLLEAIFASFLLLTSLALSVYLLNASLHAEANNERRILAALVAESALEEIRAASNTNFEGLGGLYDGREWTFEAFPDHRIRARVRWVDLPVPCTELEQQYPVTVNAALAGEPNFTFEPVVFRRSLWQVDLNVRWSTMSSDQVQLTGHIADWRDAGTLTIRLTPNPGGTPFKVAPNGTVDFAAELRRNGQAVEDSMLTWYIEPLTGFGSVARISRDGNSCTYRNAYINYDGTIAYAPGSCFLVVRGVYQGQEVLRKVEIVNE